MRVRLPLLTAAALAAPALTAPVGAQAEPAVGLLEGGRAIAHFDTADPSALSGFFALNGLGADERMVGIDYRYVTKPGTLEGPGLYGVAANTAGSQARVYKIDSGTGAVRAIGAAAITIPAPGVRWTVDFNPFSDRLRLVNDGDENLRIDADEGDLAGNDADVNPAGVVVTGIAHDRVGATPAATTVFAVNSAGATFGRLGGVDNAPSANGGAYTAIGPLGITPDSGTGVPIDISSGVNDDVIAVPFNAVGAITSGGIQRLYNVSLSTGAATAIGPTGARLSSLALLPYAAAGFRRTPGFAPPVEDAPDPVSESAGKAALTVFRAFAASSLPVTWTASNGQHGTAVLPAGQATATIDVPFAQDAVDEPDEVVTVTLAQASVPFRLGYTTDSFTIVDDDPPPAAPAVLDTSAPTLALGPLPKSITYKKLTTGKGLQVEATPSEAAALSASLVATLAGGVKLRAVRAPLVVVALPLAAGKRTLSVKPKTRDFKRPKKTVSLRLEVTAADSAGNGKTETRSIKVKPR